MESDCGDKIQRRIILWPLPGRSSRGEGTDILLLKKGGNLFSSFFNKGVNNPIFQGRLSLGDGSIYDGMWRYGKRSGLGTFYFSNGDVFRGSWRDDVMHGKVWLNE